MKKRNIFAVVGGALVLAVAYVLASVATIVALAFGLQTADKAHPH